MKKRKTILLIILLSLCVYASGQDVDIFLYRCTTPLTKGNSMNDNIGLSSHERHLRGTKDTLTVTTRHEGWTVDSVMAYERSSPAYKYPFEYQTFYLSKKERRRIAKGKSFEKSFRWLILKTEKQKLTLTATRPWSKRMAMIYLHKGDYADSLMVTQDSFQMWNFVTPIDLYPDDCVFPASGGILEATTRRTTWWIDEIFVYNDKHSEINKRIFSQKEKDERVANQECLIDFDWIRLENKGKELKIVVEPNNTGKKRYFSITLKCKYLDNKGKEQIYIDTFKGKQEG